MTDQETTAAVVALTHRLRERDAAMRDGTDHADPEVFALEFVTAMLGYGWRHVAALAKPKPVPAEVKPGARAELIAKARADCDRATEAQQAALKARDIEPGAA